MKKENEVNFVIDLEGRIYRQDVNYREIDPGEAMQKAFATSVVARTRNILELPGHGNCHMVLETATNIQYWSVPMNELVLRTTFGAGKPGSWNEGEVYPTFAEKESDEVPMEVIWNKGDGMGTQIVRPMDIRFVAEVQARGPGYYVRDHFLFAFDDRKAAYKLPLGNLYENCRLCMGDYDSTCSTAAGAVILALKQFRHATWNADLFTDADLVQRFFRFKPLDQGFKTLPILESWTDNCCKVATPNLKYVEI